jgi:hypothetical protein
VLAGEAVAVDVVAAGWNPLGTVEPGRCTTTTCGGGAAAGRVAGVADGVEAAPPAMMPTSPMAPPALRAPATMRAPAAAWPRRRGRASVVILGALGLVVV